MRAVPPYSTGLEEDWNALQDRARELRTADARAEEVMGMCRFVALGHRNGGYKTGFTLDTTHVTSTNYAAVGVPNILHGELLARKERQKIYGNPLRGKSMHTVSASASIPLNSHARNTARYLQAAALAIRGGLQAATTHRDAAERGTHVLGSEHVRERPDAVGGPGAYG